MRRLSFEIKLLSVIKKQMKFCKIDRIIQRSNSNWFGLPKLQKADEHFENKLIVLKLERIMMET